MTEEIKNFSTPQSNSLIEEIRESIKKEDESLELRDRSIFFFQKEVLVSGNFDFYSPDDYAKNTRG